MRLTGNAIDIDAEARGLQDSIGNEVIPSSLQCKIEIEGRTSRRALPNGLKEIFGEPKCAGHAAWMMRPGRNGQLENRQ
ncbi:hypothetical protein [Mesorhizobium sp. J18]|uniref:hypothetical protein n=1 Tax=Mesorhizobium sp. J18 TaxID=935263 RepID=UPI0011A87689|nr:hypothetical protein [Mesorhizobium sp. J18]